MKDKKSKPWWKSKTVWAAILVMAVAAVQGYDAELLALNIKVPYEAIIFGLGLLGLWGRNTATKVIK